MGENIFLYLTYLLFTPHSYFMSMISYSLVPDGTVTLTESSSLCPIKALPTGEVQDILPSLLSASSSPTIF